eukprot:3938626-Rhodomonas_salina.4
MLCGQSCQYRHHLSWLSQHSLHYLPRRLSFCELSDAVLRDVSDSPPEIPRVLVALLTCTDGLPRHTPAEAGLAILLPPPSRNDLVFSTAEVGRAAAPLGLLPLISAMRSSVQPGGWSAVLWETMMPVLSVFSSISLAVLKPQGWFSTQDEVAVVFWCEQRERLDHTLISHFCTNSAAALLLCIAHTAAHCEQSMAATDEGPFLNIRYFPYQHSLPTLAKTIFDPLPTNTRYFPCQHSPTATVGTLHQVEFTKFRACY